ncbi:PAC2 family protein, partial [Dehalococcoidia bacterium]|nr:PAC2 family protein [Dehalococcoidia bacterium]
MRIGSFELQEPLPQLRKPHVISSLRPWVDAGSVGSLALARLERHLGAQDLGGLATPGTYFDFTRYRPIMYYVEGQREMTIPNTLVHYAVGSGEFDFIFLHLLEPHAFAEEYINSVTELLRYLEVQRYCRIGGMYDAVPHTRPILVTGSLGGKDLVDVSGITPSRRSTYQGPTSIMNLMGERLNDMAIDNMTLMARLPQYVQLDEDYSGAARLLNVICSLYGFPEELAVSRRGIRQYERVSAQMERNAGVRALVERLETDYDARLDPDSEDPSEEPPSPLSSAVE